MRVVLTFLAVALAVSAGAAAATREPALRVLDRDPLVLRATGFAPGERVVVRASGRDDSIVRRLRASRTGAFTARLDARYDWCLGVNLVQATGARSGSVRIRPSKRFCVDLD